MISTYGTTLSAHLLALCTLRQRDQPAFSDQLPKTHRPLNGIQEREPLMAASGANGKLSPYENKNWAMLIKADPDHPLEPGTDDGTMTILIQNVSATARKLNTYIGLTYRSETTPGQVVFTTPWEKADTLNVDTAVGGTFAPDGLPGDKVLLSIEPADIKEPKVIEAEITSIEQDRKVWSFLPHNGWIANKEYMVTAWSELDGRSSAPTTRKFKAIASTPSVTILTPGKDGAEISPKTRLTGSYGGTIKKQGGISITHNGSSATVRQDYPERGTWTVDPPESGWEPGANHIIKAQAQNESDRSALLERNFKVVNVRPGKPRITVPPKSPTGCYSIYKPPHLGGVVDPWMQSGISQGPCDRVTVSDPAQPEQIMTARLDYDSDKDTYKWSLEADWTFSDIGVTHDVEVVAWLGDERSDPDSSSKISFIMKTPDGRDNPIRFISPQQDDPEVDTKAEISGLALRDTPHVTISEREGTMHELPRVVLTTTDEHATQWSWKPESEWKKGRHTVVVTASQPSQMNALSFTVAGLANITISNPGEGAKIYSHDELNGRLPKDAIKEPITIEDTCGGNTQIFSAENRGDRTFHYTPSGEGWRTGKHSVVAKTGNYTSDERHFEVAGKKVVVITSEKLVPNGTINFQIPDSWDKLTIQWTDGQVTEEVVTATKKQLIYKPSGYPNYPFSVYQPPNGYWKTGTYRLKCWNADGELLGEDSRKLTV
ncbi:hypothetical protein [Streptomyces sp. NPDC059003]|uniref:hypothetical protein n=1 Tax=Streptomyces sp. NPDC059003 TaxID=3346691 RepID=UPI00368CA97C